MSVGSKVTTDGADSRRASPWGVGGGVVEHADDPESGGLYVLVGDLLDRIWGRGRAAPVGRS